MNCPCGSQNCTKDFCCNNWLQCKICKRAGHEDKFYGKGARFLKVTDDSNRDEVICGNCMLGKEVCSECREPKEDIVILEPLMYDEYMRFNFCRECLESKINVYE